MSVVVVIGKGFGLEVDFAIGPEFGLGDASELHASSQPGCETGLAGRVGMCTRMASRVGSMDSWGDGT
jgi:hypothetical protein